MDFVWVCSIPINSHQNRNVAIEGVARKENAVALLYHLEQVNDTLPCSTTIAYFVKTTMVP